MGQSRSPSPEPVQRNRKARRSAGIAKTKPNFDPRPPHQCQCIQGTAVDHGTHSHPVSGPRRSVRVGFRIDLQPVQPTGKVPCSRWGV